MPLPDISENKREVGKKDYYKDGDDFVGVATMEVLRMNRAEIQTLIDHADEDEVMAIAKKAEYQAILDLDA